ncbi:MAG TPA: FAD-dependent oxidoreductase [Solirubrobacterales bacterium]|nr:FAD-dependent oxidoreductase [Solirubrobacterales bacterium]
MKSRPRILVLGGGFAGLESAFLLRMRLRDAAEIDLVTAGDSFVFRPNSIYVPFGMEPDSLLVDLAKPMRRREIGLHRGTVTEVDPDARSVALADGTTLPYDKLVIATGADTAIDEVPGLGEHAATIWTAEGMLKVRESFERVAERARAGQPSRVLFLVPPNNKCSGPLYEVVMMFETWLRRQGARENVSITWSTFERSFIQAFGSRLHDLVTGEFRERDIDGHTEERVKEVTAEEVRYEDGSSRAYDELIAFPPYVSAVSYGSLPSDDRGFIDTELETRRVAGHPEIYAPGDAGDFPVKQAFLAFLQADTVAEHIASDVLGTAFELAFDPVSMCVMEMFDKATFAQVPLELTDDPEQPVRLRPGAEDDYKVGTSKAWRMGKKMLGFSVPMRFSAGEPFHAGMGWRMMDVGLRGMAGMLAD